MILERQKKSGFTLIELMVVIVIIIMMAGIAIPATSDFMRSRRLKGAGSIIQAACMRARSRAIAERERQYLVFFVHSDATSASYDTPDAGAENWDVGTIPAVPPDSETGKPNTIHAFDSNENVTNGAREKVAEDPIMYLPEFTRMENPGGAGVNFGLSFRPDGTIRFYNLTDRQVDPDDATDASPSDLRITQANSDMRCWVDIVANTGRVRFTVKD